MSDSSPLAEGGMLELDNSFSNSSSRKSFDQPSTAIGSDWDVVAQNLAPGGGGQIFSGYGPRTGTVCISGA